MATATLERTETTQNGTKTTAKTAMPVLDVEINGIASKNGLQPDYVANQISVSGGVVAKVGNVFVTSRDAWNSFVDNYLNQIRDRLLGSTQTSPTENSKLKTQTSARAKAPARKPAKSKTATPKPTESGAIRFKSFKLSNSYSKTLGNFLDAQKWDAQKRIEIVEAIANVPATPTDETSTAEQCIKRIINVYPPAKRRGGTVRQGLIEAAKGMTGLTTA